MARWKFSGRRVPKFKQGNKVRVKQDSSSPYCGLCGTVKLITAQESGMVYGIDFQSVPTTPTKLASYAPINEADLEVG